MKYVITESRLEKLAINWLNDNFGDLEPVQSEKYPNFIYYKKNNKVIFEYNKKYEKVSVGYDKIWSFFEHYFSMEYQQIQELIKLWVEERYNLSVTTITSTSIYN
jgi:hypothetical protein